LAKIAFIGDDLALRSCIDAVVGTATVEVNVKAAHSAAYDAVVVDASALGFGADLLANLAEGGPVLLLAHPDEEPADIGDNLFLTKPFELSDLRRKLKDVAKARRAFRANPKPGAAKSTAAKDVSASDTAASDTAAINAAAKKKTDASAAPERAKPQTGTLPARLASAIEQAATISSLSSRLWLVGPTGVGKRQIVSGLASRFELPMHTWSGDTPSSDCLVWVPELDRLDLTAQDLLGDFVEMRQGLVVVASPHDCGAALEQHRFSRRLYHLLAGSVLAVESLSSQRAQLPTLVTEILEGLAERSGFSSITVDPKGMELLATYPWPGNYLELEGVLIRSVASALHITKTRTGKLKLGAEHLLLAPVSSQPLFDESDGTSASAAVAASVPASVDSLEEPTTAKLAVVRPVGSATPALVAGTTSGVSIELLVAGLAHDLRNPMVTLNTFASLARSEDSKNEMAALAVIACARADAQLDLLQSYVDLAEPSPEIVELVELLENAGRDDSDDPALMIDARYPVAAVIDPEHARFLAAALAEEAAASNEPCQTTVNLEDGSCEIIFALPESSRATAHLSQIVGSGEQLPWRLALAADVAARNGAELKATTVGEDLIVRLLVKAAAEQDLEEPREASTQKRGRR
jgi:DNA-binding NtrC family response regulator